MKKIFLSLLAVAALASCTKSEVLYEAPQEIGLVAVAGNITKAPIDGNTYPEELDMYVYAETTDNSGTNANYINNALFAHRSAQVDGIEVWGGKDKSYYWPNSHNLHFAGYSASGNVANLTPVFSFGTTGSLSITGYQPGENNENTDLGANDLMWFPTTELLTSGGYDKSTQYVPVEMYHTCSWLTFLIKGETATAGYNITNIAIQGIDKTADVTCSAETNTVDGEVTLVPSIEWNNNAEQGPQNDGTYSEDNIYNISIASSLTLTTDAINVETGDGDDATTANKNESLAGGNIVVIPQLPGKIRIDWTYTAPAGGDAMPDFGVADLSLNGSGTKTTEWEPGKHYIYTITIKANEILVAPSPVDWTLGNYNVTVE